MEREKEEKLEIFRDMKRTEMSQTMANSDSKKLSIELQTVKSATVNESISQSVSQSVSHEKVMRKS